MARTARRYLAAIRLEETLHLEISCASWALERVGFEQLRGCDGKLVAAVSIDVDERTLPNYAARVRWALNTLMLTYRRSISIIAIKELKLHQRQDVTAILPAISFQLPLAASVVGPAVRSEALCELTLCQCSLPPSLGLMVTMLRRLRLWDCVMPAQHDATCALVASLASLPRLEDFAWAGERHGAPTLLLEACPAGRARSLSSLVLSCATLEWDSLDGGDGDGGGDDGGGGGDDGGGGGGNDGGGGGRGGSGSVWRRLCGEGLKELILLDHSDNILPAPASDALLATLASVWRHTLRVLSLGHETLSSLLGHQQQLGSSQHQGWATNAMAALPATLESLGTVDCSWLHPVWFFEGIRGARSLLPAASSSTAPSSGGGAAAAAAAATLPPHSTAAMRVLSRLSELTIFINSPGATATAQLMNQMSDLATLTAEAWPSAVFEPGCALHRVARCIVETLPQLERLFVVWYDEDDVDADGCAQGRRRRL